MEVAGRKPVFPRSGFPVCRYEFYNPPRWGIRPSLVSYITHLGELYDPPWWVMESIPAKQDFLLREILFLSGKACLFGLCADSRFAWISADFGFQIVGQDGHCPVLRAYVCRNLYCQFVGFFYGFPFQDRRNEGGGK